MTDDPLSRLRQSVGASREFDQVCEAVASEYIDAGVEPPFRVPSADFATDPWLVCADRYWRRRFLQQPTVDVAARCARWLIDHADPEIRPSIIAKWALGYAFITRDTVEVGSELALATGRIAHESDSEICYFAALYHAGKLRADFWFDELARFLDSSLLVLSASHFQDSPLFVALRAFAAFGRRAVDDSPIQALELLDVAWNTAPRSAEVVDICLHALDVGPPFAGQGEHLRRRAIAAIDENPDRHLAWYRLARGHRMCGDYDDALTAIETALRCLPAIGARTSHEHLQERYVRERDFIAMMKGIAPRADPPRSVPMPMLALLATIAATAVTAAVTASRLPPVSSLRDGIGRVVLFGISLVLCATTILVARAWRTPPARRTAKPDGPTSSISE
ncbi:tetratricopeptide repeat protein [Frankia sp. ACN10a]|uniref:tetratricopeptide repeat protein n=1 Tax=Frankia sp. ACN10a TaxID=2926031 RepID=UPI0021189056|nr:tetratricopeptide repeat protein [Frankia sp. ACN10a]